LFFYIKYLNLNVLFSLKNWQSFGFEACFWNYVHLLFCKSVLWVIAGLIMHHSFSQPLCISVCVWVCMILRNKSNASVWPAFIRLWHWTFVTLNSTSLSFLFSLKHFLLYNRTYTYINPIFLFLFNLFQSTEGCS
jgi:hypothetical protein